MNASIWNDIAATPWWVVVIYAWLLVGAMSLVFSAKQAQIVSLKRLFVVPSLVFLIALIYLYFTLSFTLAHIAIWLSTLFLGMFIGWLQFWWLKIKAIKQEAKLYIPGSYSLLIILPLLLALKFYYHIDINLNMLTSSSAQFNNLIVSLSGLFAGVLVGRFAYALRCLKKGPYYLPTLASH